MHVRDMLKRGLAVGISAAVIGGLAAGTFVSAEESAAKANVVSLLRTADKEASDDNETAFSTKGYLDVSDIVEEAMPSVVSITTKSVQEVMDYFSMFGYYGGYAPQEREVEGRGSGVIIGKSDDDLLIATNYHVVEGAETISVGFINNTAVEGRVKGYDQDKDLAVIAVKRDDIDEDTLNAISIAKVGSSDDVKVGQQVVAIGNAMGYGQSVTTGIVSAKTRYSESSGSFYAEEDDSTAVNMIQTDAAINPGNSGGALLNMDGELIGINCAKLASTEVEGMGYAIAISDVDDEILEDLMNEEERDKLAADKHGILGITGATVSSEEAKKYGFPTGVYVSEVTDGSGADKAGIEEGDFIVKFKNKNLSSINELVDYINYYAPGEEIELTINHEGEEKVVTVTLGEQTEDYQKNAGIVREDADDRPDRPDKDRERDDRDDDDYYDDDHDDYFDDDDEYDDDDHDDYLDEYDDYARDFDDIWDSWGNGLFGED
ncbi:MAG: trypsin-like peptidase domain-containing protein [Blautia sp.]|nr:trypsin-like peptidase domain-containing protein [Blautia sp.]